MFYDLSLHIIEYKSSYFQWSSPPRSWLHQIHTFREADKRPWLQNHEGSSQSKTVTLVGRRSSSSSHRESSLTTGRWQQINVETSKVVLKNAWNSWHSLRKCGYRKEKSIFLWLLRASEYLGTNVRPGQGRFSLSPWSCGYQRRRP